MASSRGIRSFVFSWVFALAVAFAFAAGPASRPARAGVDAGADGERYAQKVASAVSSHIGEVRACYAVALERNPKLGGRFDAKWMIDTAGKPQAVQFEKPPSDAEFTACMVRTIMAWRFEAAPEPTEVMFPFVFNAVDPNNRFAPPQAPPAAPAPPAAAPPAPAPPASGDGKPKSAPSKPSAAQKKRAPSPAPGTTDTRRPAKP